LIYFRLIYLISVEIDERSPSEDEREAEAVLHAPQSSIYNARASNVTEPRSLDHVRHSHSLFYSNCINIIIKGNFNVLEQHHQRNRPNRAPTVSHLTSAATQQEQLQDQPCRVGQTDNSITTNNEVASSGSGDQHSPAPRRSKSQRTPHPTTIKYYPASWKTVLERAKKRFERYTFINHGFAARNQHLSFACAILHEEIARGKADQLTLDNGKMCYFFMSNP
jgi:hypothetical protein